MSGRQTASAVLRVLLGAEAYLLAAHPAGVRACPDCTVGRATRTLVWSDDFAFNLTVALAPFAFIIAASILADRIGRPSSSHQ